ncbi:MAG: hypothetical protein U0T82_18060 [Bacteroidales bacterium]
MHQDELIQNLTKKVRILMALNEKHKQEKIQLMNENKNLNEIVKTKQKEIAKFEEKMNTLRLARVMLSANEDKHEAKLKVNRIVREIDKCIALLNK